MSKKMVLVIDDDEHLCTIFSKALSNRGYETLTAAQGAEGVHLARKNRPNLILIDIRMPVMDGWGALRYLKAYDETKHIPICGVTGHPARARRLPQDELGFDAVIRKPVDPSNLVAMVEERIGPPT